MTITDIVSVDDRVEAGLGEDADTGTVVEIIEDQALIAWDSGVKTWTPMSILDIIP